MKKLILTVVLAAFALSPLMAGTQPVSATPALHSKAAPTLAKKHPKKHHHSQKKKHHRSATRDAK